MTLSTHVLDTGSGLPAAGLPVRAERHGAAGWALVAEAVTDTDGRVRELVGAAEWGSGGWRIRFDTGRYLGADAFWPEVVVTFSVADPERHHHIPILLSAYGYSTYRGS